MEFFVYTIQTEGVSCLKTIILIFCYRLVLMIKDVCGLQTQCVYAARFMTYNKIKKQYVRR